MVDVWVDLLDRSNHSGTQTLSTILDAGTAAAVNVGANIGEVIRLVDVNGVAGLPAVDGSAITGLPIGSLAASSIAEINLIVTDATLAGVGVAVGDVPQLININGVSGLPAVDGSQLTGIQTGAGLVDSVFGRIGTVDAAPADYSAAQVYNDSVVDGLFVNNALDTLNRDKATIFVQVDDPSITSVVSVGDVWMEVL